MQTQTTQLIKLIPPLLAECNIKQKISCIRPHRERIFRTSVEKIGKKTIFHNYGHGGAGWTFLFGCVQESMRQFHTLIAKEPPVENQPICVIGAGCYGLLTAILLAREGYRVRIVAQETDEIPSYKAAGFFFPRWRKSSSEQEKNIFLNRGIESYTQYLAISQGTHLFIKSGVRIVPAYFGLDIDPGFSPYINIGLIKPPQKVAIDFGNGKQYLMNEYQIIFMDTEPLMQELHRNRVALGVEILKTTINSWDEISESVIFNCSGGGAKKLTGDPQLLPVQGHLIALTNQPIGLLQYMINVKVVMKNSDGSMRDELIYFAPKDQGILGITFLRNQSNIDANQHEFDRLLQRCQDFFGK